MDQFSTRWLTKATNLARWNVYAHRLSSSSDLLRHKQNL
jgi:hypothetical protein